MTDTPDDPEVEAGRGKTLGSQFDTAIRNEMAEAMAGRYVCATHGYRSAILPCPQPECTSPWNFEYQVPVLDLEHPWEEIRGRQPEVDMRVSEPRTFTRKRRREWDRGAHGGILAVRTLWVWVEVTEKSQSSGDVDGNIEGGEHP